MGVKAARRDDGADLIAARAVGVQQRIHVALRVLARPWGLSCAER